MRQGRGQRNIATVQADQTHRSQTVTHLWRWLHRPAGRILIQFLICLTAFPPWAWGDLSSSYRWSTAPYLETFARLVTLLDDAIPTVTSPPPASDFAIAQATPPTPVAVATPNPDSADAVWVAKHTIVKLAAATGGRLLELTDIQNARALALDAQRGVLWAYGHRHLHAYQFNGTVLRRIPVPRSGGNSTSSDDDDCDGGEKSSGDDDDNECSDGDGHISLAVNSLNGTVWLGTNKTLRHFSHEGIVLGTFPLPHHIRALVFDPAQAWLWVGTKTSVKAHNDAGALVQTINLGTTPDVQDLSLRDNSSGELWVALKDTLRRYSRTGTLLRQLTVKQIAVLASDGQGQVWASTNVSLLRIDLTGKILLTLPQFKGNNQLVALATDPVDLSVWAASKKTVWEVSAQGKVLRTVDFRTGPPIHDLVVYVDTTAPGLTFVEPTEGAVLTTHKPTLKLSYRDSGQGVNPDTLEIRHTNTPLTATCTHSNGEATCVPTTDLPGGPITLSATIEDFAGNLSAPATRSFRINRAPSAKAGTDQTVTVGTTVLMDGSASNDPDNEPLTYQWQFSLKPANSTTALQDPTTATPSFVPDVPGLYSLQLTVTDPYGATDTDLVNITAEVPNHPPTITSTAVTTATVGQPYTYDVEATDPDAGDVLTFSLVEKPDRMTINATTGLIEWTPTAAQVGDQPVAVKVQDQEGFFAEQSFTVTVSAAPVNHAPVAENDTYAGEANTLLSVSAPGVLNNDTDQDSDVLVAQLSQGPSKGTVNLKPDGSFTYTPQPPAPSAQLSPVLKWSWTSSTIQPNALNVMTVPAVIDLDGNGVPEIVFGSTASTGGSHVDVGVLRALRGETGQELFTIVDPTLAINPFATVAAGDIDGDGKPELIVGDSSGLRLIAFEHDGTFKWRSPTLEPVNWGAPTWHSERKPQAAC